MSFNRDNLRKGSEAIDEALKSSKNRDGDFRPFLPNIYWKNDQDSRYLLILNPLEEIPEVDFHPFLDCDDGVPHMAFARTDRSIGESNDPIQDEWGYKPRLTGLAIAAELEPVIEAVNGRPKPVGFEVKTVTFERRIRDAEGELTDEREEVTAPVVGLIAQSPFNFFNQLKQYDATEGPIHATPLKITRLGKDKNVTYNIVGYDMITPDLTALLSGIENLSYVTDPEALTAQIEAADDVETATIAIGDYLLYRRIEELADDEEYEAIRSKITKPAKFQDTKKDKDEKSPRQSRPSQRRTAPAEEAPSEPPPVNKESPAPARLEKLRQRSNGAKKS